MFVYHHWQMEMREPGSSTFFLQIHPGGAIYTHPLSSLSSTFLGFPNPILLQMRHFLSFGGWEKCFSLQVITFVWECKFGTKWQHISKALTCSIEKFWVNMYSIGCPGKTLMSKINMTSFQINVYLNNTIYDMKLSVNKNTYMWLVKIEQ